MRKKLTSRKFWSAIGTAAYFAAMAIKEQNDGNQLASIIFGVCVGAVIVAWIMVEGICDSDDEEVLIEDESAAYVGEEEQNGD